MSFYAENASINEAWAYLDGNGGVKGSQQLRIAIYADQNHYPSQLVLTSDVVTITAGDSARWLRFPIAPHLLPSGRYWFLILSGGTQGVARDFANNSTPGEWVSATDTFADGPADPFGVGRPRVPVSAGDLLIYGMLKYPHSPP